MKRIIYCAALIMCQQMATAATYSTQRYDNCLVVDSQSSAGTTCYWCDPGNYPVQPGCRAADGAVICDQDGPINGPGKTIMEDNRYFGWYCGAHGWIRSRFNSNCMDGEYYDSGAATCLECPKPNFIAPYPLVPQTGIDGQQPPLTACYIDATDGLSDESGTFELTGPCHHDGV